MKNIKLGYDKDGNFLVDLAGLIYLIQENCIAEGACIYMTESSGSISEYMLVRDTDINGSSSDKFSLVLIDSEPDTIYMEVDGYAFSAKYLILSEDVTLEDSKNHTPAIFRKIHYEEALARMKKEETVYLQEKKDVYTPKQSKDLMSPETIVDGDWFLKEELLPVSNENTESEKELSKTDALLMNLFQMDKSSFSELKEEFELKQKDNDLFDFSNLDSGDSSIIEELSLESMREVLHTLHKNDMIRINKADNDSDADYLIELLYTDEDDDFSDDYDEWLDDFI